MTNRNKTEKLTTKYRGYGILWILSVLFFSVVLASAKLQAEKNIHWTGLFACKLLLLSLLFSFLTVLLTGLFIKYLVPILKPIYEKIIGEEWQGERKGSVLFRFVWIALAYLPAYLAYYPGICSYDITIQEEQILSHQYIEHHPLAHTLLVEGFLRFGKVLGSANLGMGLYTLFQMLLLAFALAYGISVVGRFCKRRGTLLVLQLYAMFFPYHWYMALSTTKDTLFAAFCLLYLVLFFELLEEETQSVKKYISFVGTTVGMILYRNNAKFAVLPVAFLLFVVLILAKNRKLFIKLFALNTIGFVMGVLVLTLLSKAVSATAGDKREMLSIPIQQLSRVMVYHEEEVGEKDKALINDFLLDEAYRMYRPEIADPVKKHTYTYVFRYRFKEFMGTYLGLMRKYPGDYINAVLAVDAGYLYPFDESHAWINVNGKDVGLGFIQTRFLDDELYKLSVYRDSKMPALRHLLEVFADRNMYLQLPVLRYIFMPGCYLWAWIFVFGYLWWKKKYKRMLPVIFVLAYLGTLLLGPTVQLRYLYPFMIALPFGMGFAGKRD